jgi:diamine N-acetyltransferase
VEEDGQWAGFALATLGLGGARGSGRVAASGTEPHLSGLRIPWPRFGRGLAAQLVANLLAAAALRGSRSVWLNVWQESAQAIRFYQKHGFETVGRSVFTVGDDAKDDWVMTQVLPTAWRYRRGAMMASRRRLFLSEPANISSSPFLPIPSCV